MEKIQILVEWNKDALYLHENILIEQTMAIRDKNRNRKSKSKYSDGCCYFKSTISK